MSDRENRDAEDLAQILIFLLVTFFVGFIIYILAFHWMGTRVTLYASGMAFLMVAVVVGIVGYFDREKQRQRDVDKMASLL